MKPTAGSNEAAIDGSRDSSLDRGIDAIWRDQDADGLPRAGFPGSGLFVLIGVVLMGLLPAAYYMWARPRMEQAYAAQIQEAPTTARGRLEKWFEFGAAMIHHRIAKVGRFSEQYPWIVTHAQLVDGEEAVAHGLDATTLTPEMCRLDGLTVVLELPAPERLGTIRLAGERGRFVPLIEPGETPPDEVKRLRDLTLWFLEDLPNALSRDILGASLELRIGGEVVIPRLPAPEGAVPAAGDPRDRVEPVGGDDRVERDPELIDEQPSGVVDVKPDASVGR